MQLEHPVAKDIQVWRII